MRDQSRTESVIPEMNIGIGIEAIEAIIQFFLYVSTRHSDAWYMTWDIQSCVGFA